MFEALGQAFAKAGKTPTDARTVRTAVVAKLMVLEENFKPVFCGTDAVGETCTWKRYCTDMRKDGVWGGCKELLAAAELWNLRIVVVRPGHGTALVGEGERIVWLKLESRHCEFLASDNSEEFKAACRAHIKDIAEIYKIAFSKLDSAKDDCVKDLDGGAAFSGGLPLEDCSPSVRSLSCSYVRSNKRARVMCSKDTSSDCSLSVCEKMSPSARGLT